MELEKKSSYLIEADEKPENENTDIEPTAQDILDLLNSGELKIEDVDAMHNEGQISDEVYSEVIIAYTGANNPYDINDITQKVQNGEITEQDLTNMVNAGQLTDEEKNQILSSVQADQPIDPSMADQQMDAQPEMVPQPIIGKFQLVKLFDKFIDLKKYISIYIEAYNDIETDELTSYQLSRLSALYKNILILRDNLEFYMNNNYSDEEYKKNLYTYMLFSKEFAEDLKKFRHVLALNPNELIKEQEHINELRNKDKDKDKK